MNKIIYQLLLSIIIFSQTQAQGQQVSASVQSQSSKVIEITNPDYFSDIIYQGGVQVVFFYAQWCATCKKINPYFEQNSLRFQDYKFLKINVDNFSEYVYDYQIENIPTFVIMKNRGMLSRYVGTDNERLLILIQGAH